MTGASIKKHRALRRFVQTLIAFRRAEASLRREDFLTGRPVRPGGLPDVGWFSSAGGAVDWAGDTRSLQCVLGAVAPDPDEAARSHNILIMSHAGVDPCRFTLPESIRRLPWKLFINTANKAPDDIYPKLDGPAPPSDGALMLDSRSLVCYIAADKPPR